MKVSRVPPPDDASIYNRGLDGSFSHRMPIVMLKKNTDIKHIMEPKQNNGHLCIFRKFSTFK